MPPFEIVHARYASSSKPPDRHPANFCNRADGLYRAESPFFVGVFMLLSMHMMISASLYADRITASFLLMRFIALECFIVMLVQSIAVHSLHGTEFWLMVLIAEYAATIRFDTPGHSGGGKTG